jgi:hypothetical protein
MVLHTLRCIGFSIESRVATATGLTLETTTGDLENLKLHGLVIDTPGPFGGWALTDEGRLVDQRLINEELEITGARDHVQTSYESFLRLNPSLLGISTDWQMVRVGDSHIINDHRDSEYDSRVLARLIKIDWRAQRICADLSGGLTRFGSYGPRLSTALGRALAGDHAFVTDDLESYHNVWFQLHEDLLVTLGIYRDDERRPAPSSSSWG